MAIFIEYPFLAAVVGIVLLGLVWRTRHRTAVGAGVVWLLYSVYELGMKQRWLCSGECDIRIDLLVIYPVLLLCLLAAGLSFLWRPGGPRPPA